MLEDLLKNPISWLVAVNIAAFLGSFALFLAPGFKRLFFKMPRVVQQSYVFLVSGLPCILPLFSQPRFSWSWNWLFILMGAACVLGAIVVIALAFRQIGLIPSLIPEDQKGKVINTSVYATVRHPIYSSAILLALGLTLSFRASYSLIYLPVFIVLLWIMTVFEERDLIKEYGQEYVEYKRQVPYRLIPKLF